MQAILGVIAIAVGTTLAIGLDRPAQAASRAIGFALVIYNTILLAKHLWGPL